MPKKPMIANEDEHAGWNVVLRLIEDEIKVSEEHVHRGSWPKHVSGGMLSAYTRARDSLIGPIRAYQESREVPDE